MFPASNNGPLGQCLGAPDVCNTPSPSGAAPIPYPNLGMLVQSNPATVSNSVKIFSFKAATVKTEILMSTGDEAGSAGGGVVCAMIKGPCKYKLGSMSVKIEGQQAVYHGSIIGHNNATNSNMPAGVQVAPSQFMVTVGL